MVSPLTMTYKHPPRTVSVPHPSPEEVAPPAFVPVTTRTHPKFPPRVASAAETPSDIAPAAAHPSPTLPWYEDLRFGTALLIILALLNLALMYAIPLAVPASNDTVSENVSINVPAATSQPNITFYTQPDRPEGEVQLPQAHPAPSSTTPAAGMGDFPPPKAAPLDGKKSMEENIHNDTDQQ